MVATKGPYYLGRVTRVPHRGDAYYYATVEPLVESDPTGAQWLGPLRDARTRFPKRGLVHWHDAPFDLRMGSVWQFTVGEHPSAERGGRLEQYQLDDSREPIEVVDLREWSDEAALRSTITGDGIPLTSTPLTRRVVLWLASGVCVGPLLIKPAATRGFWALDANGDAARIPFYRPSATAINRVTIEGARSFLSPHHDLGRSAGIQNWMSDAQVARSILARLRKMDRDVVKVLGVTDNVFREYLDHVESGRMGSADPAVERARADRLRGFRGAIQGDVALLTEAAESLLGTETVRAEVERQVEAKITQEIRARQSEVDAALTDTTKQLTQLRKTLDAKRAEDATLDAALLEKSRDLEAKVASFDRELAARLEEIARRPEAFFAEVAIMRAVLGASLAKPVGGENGTVDARPAAGPARRQMTDFGEGSQLNDDAAVRCAIAAHAGAGALSLYAMLGLHALFVAGAAPVVAGSRGYDLLRAYAFAVAGGRLHWIPIGSSMMEPQDLLGRFDGPSGRILPSAPGLLDVVIDATQTGRLHVVVLEGFNRAPSEAYLSPILEAAQAGRLGDVARAIPLASPGVLAEDDPYRAVARLTWPPTVLIACLPSDGSVTLPVPPSVWRLLGLIDADDRDRPPTPSLASGDGAPTVTEVSPSFWKDRLTTAQCHGVREEHEITTLARALSLVARDAADACRMREVLCKNGLVAAEASGLAVSATLIARTGTEPKVIEEQIRAAGVATPGWRTTWAEAQRLRS